MRRQFGYTTIEVVMALAILAIGAAGAISFQKIALLGNLEARAQDGARVVSATWTSRLEADSLVWTDEAGLVNIGATHWLTASVEKAPFSLPSASEWILAPEATGFGAPTAGIHGEDIYALDAAERVFFCTHLRLSRVIDEQAMGANPPRKVAVLAHIRVVWRKDLSPMMECRTKPPLLVEQDDEQYAFHYLPPILILRKEAPFQ